MIRTLTLLSVVATAFFVISCGSGQTVDATGPAAAFVKASNSQLAKYPIGGFAYKSSAMPQQQWTQWAKVAAPIVKDILAKVPDGYALEVRGHTCARGPEYPEGNKPGNIKISSDRAKAVYNALGGQGIKSSKLTSRGVGSSELIAGIDRGSERHRRVTFQIVPKK